LWLILLASLSFFRPSLGLALLFVSISFDPARPTVYQIIINFSELQFTVVLFAWLASISELRRLDWRPLAWGAPFLVAVTVSGLVNLPLYKVPFHLGRLSELMVGLFLVSGILRNPTASPEGSKTGPIDVKSESLRAKLIHLESAIGIAVLLHSVFGFVQLFNDGAARAFSQFANPNQFAGYLVLVLPYCLVFAFAASSRPLKVVSGYLFLIGLSALVSTQSRAALFAGAISLLLVWLLTREGWMKLSPVKRFRTRLSGFWSTFGWHALIVILAGCLLFWYWDLSESRSNAIQSLDQRLEEGLWQALEERRLPYFRIGLQIWTDAPIVGVGPGQYGEALKRYGSLTEQLEKSYPGRIRDIRTHLHSLPLQLLVEFGLLGLCGFVYFLVRVLQCCIKRYPRFPAALAGIGLVVAFLMHNLFDVTFPSLALEMGLLLGISVAQGSRRWNRGAKG
jgi:O-antigen ligase